MTSLLEVLESLFEAQGVWEAQGTAVTLPEGALGRGEQGLEAAGVVHGAWTDGEVDLVRSAVSTETERMKLVSSDEGVFKIGCYECCDQCLIYANYTHFVKYQIYFLCL